MKSSEYDESLRDLLDGSTDRQGLEEYAHALAELERRSKEFPLYFFEPNPKLRAFCLSTALIGMAAGGNRTGKTEHLAEEACCNGLGYRPWALRKAGLERPDNPHRRPDRLPKEAICYDRAGIRIQVPNTISLTTGLALDKGIGEALHPKVQKFLGPEGGPFVKKVYWSHAGTPSHVVLRNGTRILYSSATQKGLSFEATNHSWYGIDEPIPKRVYTGIRRGAIDQSAPIRFSFTPLGQHAAWMFKELYRHADGKKIDVYNLSIYDNPWLSPEEVEAFANDPTISDVEKQARIFGRFLHLIDRIYPQFDEPVHIIPGFRPPHEWFIGHVIDPHTVKPWAMAWFCVTPGGDIIFFREWPGTDFTQLRRDTRSPKEYAQLIRQIEGNQPADFRLIDPNYGPRTDVVRGVRIASTKDVLEEYGLPTIADINDDLNYGEARVRALLAYDTTQPLCSTNRPRIYFTEDCLNLINSMNYYTAANKNAEDDFPDEIKRDETHKDFADLVRYAAVSRVAEQAIADSWLAKEIHSDFDSHFPDVGAYGE